MKIVPPNATLDELRKKAECCEEEAKEATENQAIELREKATLYRRWLEMLTRIKWTS